MSFARTLTVCTLGCLIGSPVLAQGTGPMGPGMSTGTQGAPGSSSSNPTDMDLPLQPPPVAHAPPENEPPSDEPGDDPRDTPPPVIYGEEIESENDTIFYVLDISCSMRIDRQSFVSADGQTSNGARIDRAKAELNRSIMGLSANFKFNIIAYDCSTQQWKQAMQEATMGNKQSAVAWVGALTPRGATGTGPATSSALSDKDNMAVVLLTDGSPNCGASGLTGHRTMISTANTQGATINVFGIAATGTYRAFCQGVASDSGGSYFDVP